MIAAGFGCVEQAHRDRRELLLDLFHLPGVAEARNHLGGLMVQRLYHRDRRFSFHPGRYHLHQRAKRKFCLLCHVDCRNPAHRARQWVLDLPNRSGDRVERPGIEANDRVAEIVVVEQKEIRLSDTDEFAHFCAGTRNFYFHAARTLQCTVHPVVQAHRYPMRPKCRVILGSLLQHRE